MKKITAADYDIRIKELTPGQLIDDYYEPKPLHARRRVKIVLDALGPSPRDRILDLGCGVGTFAFHSSRRGAQCFGMDYSFESIKAALALTARYQPQPQFLVADGVRVPFAARCFDKIVAADFFEHVTLADKDAILKEMMRVLKDTGSAVIFTPNGIREKLGEFYWKGRHMLSGDKVPKTDLHFGLTTRSEFERLLHNNGFSFRLYFHDVTRPYLARIPGMRRIMALNLLWVLRKKELKT